MGIGVAAVSAERPRDDIHACTDESNGCTDLTQVTTIPDGNLNAGISKIKQQFHTERRITNFAKNKINEEENIHVSDCTHPDFSGFKGTE